MATATSGDAAEWKKLAGLIESCKFTMMTTAETNGTLRSRPMATHGVDEAEVGELYLFTRKSSHKMDELDANPHVNLSYISQGESRFISVSGRCRLDQDTARMKRLWKPALKSWFPHGLDDPELGLLKVTIDQAEYWDLQSSTGTASTWSNSSNTLIQAYGYAKAALTGLPHKGEGQDHGTVQLQHKPDA